MIRWEDKKAEKILRERGIDLFAVEDEILSGRFTTRPVDNQEGHPGQMMFIVVLDDYAVCAPFVEGDGDDFFIKTAFRSRKWNERRPLW